jgi:hypothetical protein
MLMQFIASITLDTARRRSEVEQALPAEQVCVRELMRQGALNALFVPDGSGVPDGLWAIFNGDSMVIREIPFSVSSKVCRSIRTCRWS